MNQRLAQFISNTFDPIPMTVLAGIIGVFVTPMSLRARTFWIGLISTVALIVIFVFFWFIRQGYVLDAKLTSGKDHHRDRLGILWITCAFLGLAVLIAWYLGKDEPLWSILIALTTVLTLTSLITALYKISIHMIGITSLVTVLLILYGISIWPIILFIPLVAWSRSTLHRHTIWQMILGISLTAGSIIGVFYLTGQL